MRFRNRDREPEARNGGTSLMDIPVDERPLNASVPEAQPLIEGIFEPPRSKAVAAISRRKGLIALCAILFTLLGAAAGLLREPTYEAAATLQVGQVNPNSPGFFSYVQSSSSLATAFSRSIAAAPVLASVERETGLPAEEAVTRLASEPIELSPAFRVIAEGTSREETMGLANAAAKAVIAYQATTNSSNPQAESLLREYQKALKDLRQAGEDVARLQGGDSSAALLDAEAARSAAKVRQKAIANAYIAAIGSEAPRTGLVSLLAGATSATSDRDSKVQLYAFVGLLGGIAVGCLAAIALGRRRRGRRRGGEAETV
jgi:hypothetical protein